MGIIEKPGACLPRQNRKPKQQVLLAGEMGIKCANRNIAGAGQIRHLQFEKPVFRNQLARAFKDQFLALLTFFNAVWPLSQRLLFRVVQGCHIPAFQ